MAFARPKKREPVGEAGLFEYAVGALSRKMRTERDLRRLMRARAFEGETGARDMDAVVVRLVELKYLSDTRFAADYTRMRKENQGFGRRRVQQDLTMKGVGKELVEAAVGAAYDEADEVSLARAYCERKRIRKPVDQKETVRVMNRLVRAGILRGPSSRCCGGGRWRCRRTVAGIRTLMLSGMGWWRIERTAGSLRE